VGMSKFEDFGMCVLDMIYLHSFQHEAIRVWNGCICWDRILISSGYHFHWNGRSLYPFFRCLPLHPHIPYIKKENLTFISSKIN
jgi:hypothetical protein